MHDNEPYLFKKGFVNYIDISIAFMNFLIIAFPLTFLSKNIIISTIGILLLGVLIIIALFKFIKSNPLYIYYCYTLFISSVFFLFYWVTINPALGGLFLPEILYLYTFSSKTEVNSQSLIPYDNSINLYLNYSPRRVNTCKIYKRAKITKRIKKQYNSKTNFEYSLILGIILTTISVFYILL